MGNYNKMEVFQITNTKIFVSDFLFKYLYKFIATSDKICNIKLEPVFYKFKVGSGHEPVYFTDVTNL